MSEGARADSLCLGAGLDLQGEDTGFKIPLNISMQSGPAQ